MFNKLRTKLLGAATLLTGAGLAGYYLHNNFDFEFNDNQSMIKSIQAKSTIITLSNYQISKRYGPYITSTIQTDNLVEQLNTDVKNFSFLMNVRQGRRDEDFDDFGEVMVNVNKTKEDWNIESIQIKFKDSNFNKWLKLYESLRLENVNCYSSSAKLDDLITSPFLEDSTDYLKHFKKKQQFILKSVEILLNNRDKINNVGSPIKLVSHDLVEVDSGFFVKMNIEGKKKNVDLLVEVERTRKDWIVTSMALMHEIKEDFMLSSKELADKYYKDFIRNNKNKAIEWQSILNEIDLAKVIEEKLIKNSRIMTTIGRPISLTWDTDDHSTRVHGDLAYLKIHISGRLNNGELALTAKKDKTNNSWNISNCEFKINWDSSHKK